jgi:hypothetical protein
VACNPIGVGGTVAPGIGPPPPQAVRKNEVKRQTMYVFEIAVMKLLYNAATFNS